MYTRTKRVAISLYEDISMELEMAEVMLGKSTNKKKACTTHGIHRRVRESRDRELFGKQASLASCFLATSLLQVGRDVMSAGDVTTLLGTLLSY